MDTLRKHEMIVFPHPYNVQGTSLRVYDVESEIGKIARAVVEPQDVPETALVDAVNLHAARPLASSGDPSVCHGYRRSTCSFNSSSGDRPRAGRISRTVVSLTSLSRPWPRASNCLLISFMRRRLSAWPAPCALAARAGYGGKARRRHSAPRLAEAARKQKDIFDRVLREAAEHLLGGAEIPSCDVDLGGLGLRYRREAQGDI